MISFWTLYIIYYEYLYYIVGVCQLFRHARLFVTPWAIACLASLSMAFSRQKAWSGYPFPCLGDLLYPGIEPGFPEDFPGGSDSKASVYNAGDPGSIPGLGRSPGEGNGNPLQYYCLENSMDRGAWQATVHGVAKSQT